MEGVVVLGRSKAARAPARLPLGDFQPARPPVPFPQLLAQVRGEAHLLPGADQVSHLARVPLHVEEPEGLVLSIPDQQCEAADLDVAGVWKKFRYVTAPNLHALIIINFMGAVIAGFKESGNIFVMTGGGPEDRSTVIGLDIWFRAFLYLDFGAATAMGRIMGALLICFTLHQRITGGQITNDGRFGNDVMLDIGTAVCLAIDNVRLVLTERVIMGPQPSLFRKAGLEPFDARIVMLKSAIGYRVT